MVMYCPYCDIEINEAQLEAEDGCCPECGSMISAPSSLMGDEFDDFDEYDSRDNEYDDYGSYDDYDKDYDTEKDNRRTKFTFKYCVQVHYTDSSESGYYQYQTPSTSSVVYINGKSIGSKTIPSKIIEEGTSWRVIEVASATTYINHNPDGSASFTFRGTGFGLGTATSTYSTGNGNFPTVPAYNMLGDIQTFDVDDGVTIPITRYVSSYYDKLEILHGEDVLKTVNNISSGFAINTPTNAQVTFTETELDNIYTKISTGSSATFTIKLTTYSDSGYTAVIGSNSKSVTGNFNILLPTFSDFGYYDSFANAVNNLTGSNQTINRCVYYVYISFFFEVCNTISLFYKSFWLPFFKYRIVEIYWSIS